MFVNYLCKWVCANKALRENKTKGARYRPVFGEGAGCDAGGGAGAEAVLGEGGGAGASAGAAAVDDDDTGASALPVGWCSWRRG